MLANIFNRMKVKGICMIFDTCYSGSFVVYKPLRKENRVIISACASYETASIFPDTLTAFFHFFYEALKKGYKTAEEAFENAKEKTENYESKGWWGTLISHPQIYDSYPGNMVIAK